MHRLLRRAAPLAAALLASACAGELPLDEAPQHLADTGLYADAAVRTIAADALPFEPQYPLWTDGAAKRRWIALPPGTAVDAGDVDDWQFPIGTRLWKEFTFDAGVETRYLQRRADGSWLYATYVRTADGDDVLAPPCGVRNFCATANGRAHDVPSVADCRACHENGRSPVLGFTALQLSSDRAVPMREAPDFAPLDLDAFVARGLVANLPEAHRRTPPHIDARTPAERAALGYLVGNCSSCHNAAGPLARLGLRFDHPLGSETAPAIATTLGIASQFTRGAARQRIAAGSPERSVVFVRLAADDALTQMPPMGRHLVDTAAVELFDRWIRVDLAASRTAFQPTFSEPEPRK